MTRGQAYNEWIAAANNHCYCSEDVWDAACDWQKKQIDLYLDEVRFELPEDIRRKLFYND